MRSCSEHRTVSMREITPTMVDVWGFFQRPELQILPGILGAEEKPRKRANA